MKSTNNEAKPFTMADFEKGLMLAGLISPSNVAELNERRELEAYEKELQEENKKLYFKRAVLAAEIATELCNEPTFGRIKFQKLVYLCEHAAKLKTQARYSKQAAGPFDHKFMHSIEREFKKQKWFEVKKINDGKIQRSKYIPLENCNKYKKYYTSYFSDCFENIKYVIDLFRSSKTDHAEIAATLLACYLEIIDKKEQFTEERLLELFYTWSDKKKRFDKTTVISTWEWLGDKGLVE